MTYLNGQRRERNASVMSIVISKMARAWLGKNRSGGASSRIDNMLKEKKKKIMRKARAKSGISGGAWRP